MGATFPISAGLRRAFIGASEVAVSQPRFLLAFFGGFPNAMKSVETDYIEKKKKKIEVYHWNSICLFGVLIYMYIGKWIKR